MTPQRSLRARRGERPAALLAGLSLALAAAPVGATPLAAQLPAAADPAPAPRAPVTSAANVHSTPSSTAGGAPAAAPAVACPVPAPAGATRPVVEAGRPLPGGTATAGAPCTPAVGVPAVTGTAGQVRVAARHPARRQVVRRTPAPVAEAAPVIAARRQVPGTRPLSAAQLVDAATREYRETGIARPVVLGAVTAFPYGVSDPVVTCAVLRACLIDLEPGERLVTKPLAGDMKPGGRWYVGTAPVGADSASTLVWVKPTDCGLTTNVVLSTDRRVYTLSLESPGTPGCERSGARAAASHITFYFPDSTVPGAVVRPAFAGPAAGPDGGAGRPRDVTLARYGALYGATAAARPEGAALAGIAVDVARMNFDYRVKRDKRFPWAPAQVFDDAVHTFIKIPPEAAAHPAPALFELTDGGSKTLMNYTVRDGFYVVDRTFRRAVLSLGQGKQEQRIELENPHFGTPVPATPNSAGAAGGR